MSGCCIGSSGSPLHRPWSVTQNFDSRDLSLVDRLSGLKYSHEDKIKKVKLIDEELLNLLELKEYEVKYEKL